ncbi:hypothetical protein [Erwinia oleae]|nr:hypothetical protein [Erwinia oleae]
MSPLTAPMTVFEHEIEWLADRAVRCHTGNTKVAAWQDRQAHAVLKIVIL